MHEIIQNFFSPFMICVLLLIYIGFNNGFSKTINRLFAAAVICDLLLIFSDAGRLVYAEIGYASLLHYTFSSLGLIFRPAIAYAILLIAMKEKSFKWNAFLALPLAFDAVISLMGILVPITIIFEANGTTHGVFYVIPYIVSALYIGIVLYETLKQIQNGNMLEGVILLFMVLFICMGTFMEAALLYSGVLTSAIAIGITFYYIFIFSNQNNYDILTGVLMRRRFYLDAARFGRLITGVISIDLNGLKEINDTKGHLSGDHALATIAKTILSVLPTGATLYRTGGDEFMVICLHMNELQVAELTRSIMQAAAFTSYSCAAGYSMCQGKEGFDEACANADKAMYIAKREMKERQRLKSMQPITKI